MTPSQRWTLAATGLGLFMIFLDALIVNVGLPAIQADFKVGEAGLQWVVAAYSLGMAVFIMSSATMADVHGRRRLYLVGFMAVAAASFAAFVWFESRSADPMMDLSLFRDRTYALAIVTICVALFTFYGMLLLTTQYLQNVRAFTPVETGLFLLPFSIAMLVASPLAGAMVGRRGTAVPIRLGLSIMMAALCVLIAGTARHPVLVTLGLAMAGFGYALCLTPITTLAMTSVPPQRAGIMSAQRAIGSTLGFAVMGSILSAWLAGTLASDLAPVIADPTERRVVARAIIEGANPRALVAEVGPAKPIRHPDPGTQEAIREVAERDFVEGIRVALGVAIVLLGGVLTAGLLWFTRTPGAAIADAQQEAARDNDP